jgi:serine/threonine-protein kinase RsbW
MAESAAPTMAADGPMSLELPFSPQSAAIARQRLADWLDVAQAPEEHRDDARLVVSELVGNAVRHARPLADGTMQVTWAATPTAIDISVTDGGALTTPERVDAGTASLAGRGLAIVETIASRWWVESSRCSTTVHALLTLA